MVADARGLTIAEATSLVRRDAALTGFAETSRLRLSIAGGVLVVIGAGTTLAWARRAEPPVR